MAVDGRLWDPSNSVIVDKSSLPVHDNKPGRFVTPQ